MSAPAAALLPALAAEHLAWLVDTGHAAHTVKNRKTNLRFFTDWCEERGITRPAEITLAVLERFQHHLTHYRQANGNPLGIDTQAQRLSAVSCWLRWLVRTGRLLHNPAADLVLPARPKRIPRAVLNVHEAEAVLARPDVSTPLGLRDRAILEVFYSCGIRRLELIRLHLRDVAAERGLVLVREGKGRKDRYVPIGERALWWLGRYLEEVRPHLMRSLAEQSVFLSTRGRPLRPNRLSDLVQRYVNAAELGKRGSCHLWRHTTATLMHEGGADIRDIQEMLGHSKLETTEVYTRVSAHRLKAVHERTHPAHHVRRTQAPA
jgi:integrase/recombinase XerD